MRTGGRVFSVSAVQLHEYAVGYVRQTLSSIRQSRFALFPAQFTHTRNARTFARSSVSFFNLFRRRYWTSLHAVQRYSLLRSWKRDDRFLSLSLSLSLSLYILKESVHNHRKISGYRASLIVGRG